jgi:uncharacterized lipoprotein YddW (UPF0748 family)
MSPESSAIDGHDAAVMVEVAVMDPAHPDAQRCLRATLTEAIALYRSAGYVEVAAFSDEPYAHHWFETKLD